MAGTGRTGTGTDARGLTDDVLVQQPPARTVRGYLRDAVDRLAGADPGLTQLRLGLQAVLGIALGVGLVYLFVHLTGALQLPAGSAPAPVLAAANRALLIVSMLLAGMAAMMAGFTVNDRTVGGQVLSSVILPVPMVAAMTLGLLVGPYRVPSLVYLVVLMTVAVYVRRWGPRGFSSGMVAFNGGFLGFFLHAQIHLADVGWLAADLAIGVLASLLVRFAVVRTDPGRTLARMRRSWDARARRLLTLSITALRTTDEAGTRALRERLRRQVVRLNESTLMIDAQLAEARPATAAHEAQELFTTEMALSNCARFAAALAVTGADAELRERAAHALEVAAGSDRRAVAAAVQALRTSADGGSRTGVLAHRLASSVEEYVRGRLAELSPPAADAGGGADVGAGGGADVGAGGGADGFSPAVQLFNGWLPGSIPVSGEASTTPGRGGLLDRATMPPYVRTTIQIAVAGSIAVGVGDLVSGPRLYWAVLSTFLAFMAATNSGEQVRRALFRVSGTALGIVVGDLLVHVTGGHVWSSLLIVLVALFFGIYLIRVNYTFMTMGITVTMAQLYVQLGEFSWQLLLLRLAETAIGVAAVVLTVLLIVPLRPQRVLTAGVLLWFRALRALLDAVLDRVDGERTPLRPLVREADAAWAGLVTTAAPLRRATFGRNSAQLVELLATSAAARQYARSLAALVEVAEVRSDDAAGARLPWEDSDGLRAAAAELRASAGAIERRIETGEHGSYVRSSALVEPVIEALRPRFPALQHALRDLTLVDGALARLAAALSMEVRDHDTTPETAGVER